MATSFAKLAAWMRELLSSPNCDERIRALFAGPETAESKVFEETLARAMFEPGFPHDLARRWAEKCLEVFPRPVPYGARPGGRERMARMRGYRERAERRQGAARDGGRHDLRAETP